MAKRHQAIQSKIAVPEWIERIYMMRNLLQSHVVDQTPYKSIYTKG